MGTGIDAARAEAPEHAAVMDNFKDQLLLVLIRRLGGKVSIPVVEVDNTGDLVLSFKIVNGAFHFELGRKQ